MGQLKIVSVTQMVESRKPEPKCNGIRRKLAVQNTYGEEKRAASAAVLVECSYVSTGHLQSVPSLSLGSIEQESIVSARRQ